MTIEYLQLGPADLATERRQLADAGRAVETLDAEFDTLIEADATGTTDWRTAAEDLLDEAATLPQRSGYEYNEPNDLDAIRAARPVDAPSLDDAGGLDSEDVAGSTAADLNGRIAGAWAGRCAGCLLGKPVELWDGETIEGFLRETDRYPLEGYLSSDVPSAVAERYPMNATTGFVDETDGMPRDDDVDFTIAALDTVERCGREFTTSDVSDTWIEGFPVGRLYTAERVAYRNVCNGYEPPATATARNPYREFIGAGIRADLYGWITPGQPTLAATLAWRDARLSHVRNGIYGAMWVAAMLAAAPVVASRERLLLAGLAQIPATSRLAEAIEDALDQYERGLTYDEAVAVVGDRWDESTLYGKFHAISNARIVAISLLWGEGFGDSICRAVEAGFDTDCNSATVGSIVGLRRGREALDERWTAPLSGRVETALSGYATPRISTLADRTVALARDESC
jgi:ADP-ribosylglycohydrolase